jgi:hypothetical protein
MADRRASATIPRIIKPIKHNPMSASANRVPGCIRFCSGNEEKGIGSTSASAGWGTNMGRSQKGQGTLWPTALSET